jgi:hypothetical protein
VAVVAAVAGSRGRWRWRRVVAGPRWWLVAEVAGSRGRWLEVAEVAENGRVCRCRRKAKCRSWTKMYVNLDI